MAVTIISRQRRETVDLRGLRRLVSRVLEDHDRGDADVTVVVGGDRLLRRLNAAYRGVDAPTDVLSFGADGGPAARARRDEAPEEILGDVVVSIDRAAAQARSRRVTLDREVRTLVAHGVLHLLGHDHERAGERRRMAALERGYARATGRPAAARAPRRRRAPRSGRGRQGTR
ncbi:MAG: rRNA maturation RNase YbeY [Candidatus Eisenbacteria bacterium]|nr:rRNA maturation RNase YbeY [Candidatus Eisenbacteria bacterium]